MESVVNLDKPTVVVVNSPADVKKVLLAFIEAAKKDTVPCDYNLRVDRSFLKHLETLLKNESS